MKTNVFSWRHVQGHASGLVMANNTLDAFDVLRRLYGLKASDVELEKLT